MRLYRVIFNISIGNQSLIGVYECLFLNLRNVLALFR